MKKKSVNSYKKFFIPALLVVIVLIVFIAFGNQGLNQNQSAQTKACEGSGVKININDACPPYWCGDGTCLLGDYRSYTESCSSCPQDCGACPSDTLSNFDILSINCDSTLSRLTFSIKNTRYESVNLYEVWINIPKGGMPHAMSQNPDYSIGSGESKTMTFPINCQSGDYFQIKITYTDSQGSHSDFGNRYDIP